MDEAVVPKEEWRFRRFVEEQFRGETQIILAQRRNDYFALRGLLAAYAGLRFSATEVLVAYSTNVAASTALRRRALRASLAPEMILRCEEFLRCKGPICPTCSTVMRPAGSAYVCEGCGSVSGRRDEGNGFGEGDTPDGSDRGPTAPAFDDGNGMIVSA